MSKKKITIASPRGIIIPAAILGLEKDYSAGPHEPVLVPADYGYSLIENRFADKVDDTLAVKQKAEEKPRAGGKSDVVAKQEAGLLPLSSGGEPGEAVDTLIGSNVQPSLIELSQDKTVTLGEAVAAAQQASGLSVAEWNAQLDDAREAVIAAAIEQMKSSGTDEQSNG